MVVVIEIEQKTVGFILGQNLRAGKKEYASIQEKNSHQHPVNKMCRPRNHSERQNYCDHSKINQGSGLKLDFVDWYGGQQQSYDQ